MTIKVSKTVFEDVDVWEWLGMLHKNDPVWEWDKKDHNGELREILTDYRVLQSQYHELVALKPERLASYAVQFDNAVKLLEKRLEPIMKDRL